MRRRAILDRRRGDYVKDQGPPPGELWFDYVDTFPATITLGSNYAGPATPANALYSVDGGKTWASYTSKTIALETASLRFRGDWRDSNGRLYYWLYKTLAQTHPVSLRGQLPIGNASTYTTSMFESTFSGCSGLSGSIPSGLFGDLSGAPATYMFTSTFYQCSGLSGESAMYADEVTHLYDYFDSSSGTTSTHVGAMYRGCTFDDQSSIPAAWK